MQSKDKKVWPRRFQRESLGGEKTKKKKRKEKKGRKEGRKKGRKKKERGKGVRVRLYANSGALIGDDKQSNYTKRAVSRRYGGRGGLCYDSRKAHVPGTRPRTRTKWLK